MVKRQSLQSSKENLRKVRSEIVKIKVEDFSQNESSPEDDNKASWSKTLKNKKGIKESKQAKVKITKQKPKSKINKERIKNLKSILKDPLELHPEESPDILLPQMRQSSLRKLQELLEFKEADESKLSLNKCTSQMRSNIDPHILFLSVLRKAIIHSLLERRWDNLVELLMMLVDNFCSVIFTNFLRQICEIICHLDPCIAGTELGAQLDLIKNKYTTKRHTTNVV